MQNTDGITCREFKNFLYFKLYEITEYCEMKALQQSYPQYSVKHYSFWTHLVPDHTELFSHLMFTITMIILISINDQWCLQWL